MKTYSTKLSDITPQWHVFDATGKTLGRLASEVATLLQGKHKPIYAPHLNTGDFVIVVNAAKVRVTGKKAQQKLYYRHSNYPGGLRSTTFARMIETHPTRVIESAVKGMIPHHFRRCNTNRYFRRSSFSPPAWCVAPVLIADSVLA